MNTEISDTERRLNNKERGEQNGKIFTAKITLVTIFQSEFRGTEVNYWTDAEYFYLECSLIYMTHDFDKYSGECISQTTGLEVELISRRRNKFELL